MTQENDDFHIHTREESSAEHPAPREAEPASLLDSSTGGAPAPAIRHTKGKIIGGIALGVCVVFIIAGVVWSYMIVRKNLTDNFSLRFARVVHLPAGFVNKTSIPYTEYVDDLRAVQHFYAFNKGQDANAAAPSDTELRKSVWERMVHSALLNQLASKYTIQVSVADQDQEFSKLSTALGSQNAADKMIQDSYGWTSAEFKQRVIMPFLLQQKILNTTSTADVVNAGPRARAEEVLAKVQGGKDQFADLAKQYSEDGSAQAGGDLGWFDEQTMVKPFSDAAFALKPGEVSGIVQTQFGFHIIKVLEREDKPGKPPRVHAAHILIRADIEQYLADWEKQSVIKQWVRVE